MAYQGLKKSDAAIAAFQRAVGLDPQDAAIHFNLGMLLAARDNGRGHRQLEAAERITPSALEAHRELALLLERPATRTRSRRASQANRLEIE